MSDIERNALIEELYEQYYDKLVLHCMTMVGYRPELLPMAEECVQEVFYLALKRHQRLHDHPDVEGWLFRCCNNRMHNMLFTYFLRSKKHAYSSDEETSPELADPYDSFLGFEENQAFYGCIDRIHSLLLENENEIFDSYFLQGYTIDEIAVHYGKSKSSIKSTIYRIRKRLKNIYFIIFIVFLITARLSRY